METPLTNTAGASDTTPAGIPILRLVFAGGASGVSMRLEPPADAPPFTCSRAVFDALPALPGELDRQGVAKLADIYKDVLRHFVRLDSMGVNNGYEQILEAYPRRQPFELRISGESPDATSNPALLPWELILYGDGIDLIERTAIVRSLGRTEGYAPTKLSDPFRTLVIQGGQLAGEPPLAFDAERISLGKAWHALGPALQPRVAAASIETIAAANLAARLRQVQPHLLWFSGHGQVGAHGVEFLFDGADGWIPVTRIADAVTEACATAPGMKPPLVAAFWACESLGRPSAPLAGLSPRDARFPDIVNAMARAGVEAVIGCQTRIWDWSARVLAEGLFRALAEGLGPARAVAAARAALVRAPDPLSEGSDVEWASPILWTGGARIPELRWARPPREDEGILLRKVCDASVIAHEGATAIVTDGTPSAATAWIAQAPTWIVHPQLEKDRLGVLAMLRRAAFEDGRALLVIPVDESRDFLRALSAMLAGLQSRLFPGVELTETEWLMAIFSLARSESRRAEAWQRLLERDDLVVAIIADAGLDDTDVLEGAATHRFPLLVFSPEPIQQPVGGVSGASWAADTFQRDGEPAFLEISNLDRDARMLVEALALLNLPMTKAMLDRFGAEFEVAGAFVQLQQRHFLVAYGARYILSAAVAYAVDRGLTDDDRRAAHRACLQFLEREPASSFVSAEAEQLRWRLTHLRALGRDDEVVHLTSWMIEHYLHEGRSDLVVRQYQSLKGLRRGLSADRLLDVAHAYNLQSAPTSALSALAFVPRENLTMAQRVWYDLRRAEALRNQNDRTKQDEATALLENTLKEASSGVDRETERRILIVRSDLARNELFFGRRPDLERAEHARDVFEDVIAQCGSDPDRVYLKVATLRNLADLRDRYAYGLPTDPQLAIEHLKDAKRLIADAPEARALLAEVSYTLARALTRAGLATGARAELEDAIRIARRDGNALILAIASNYRFWTDHANRPALTDPEWTEWRRHEAQLDTLADLVSWAARTLVSTRLRAAKRRAMNRPDEAIAVLTAARDLLKERNGLRTASDVKERWLPVYAGLAVLRANTSTQAAYDPAVWSELANDLEEAGVGSGLDPVTIWNEAD